MHPVVEDMMFMKSELAMSLLQEFIVQCKTLAWEHQCHHDERNAFIMFTLWPRDTLTIEETQLKNVLIYGKYKSHKKICCTLFAIKTFVILILEESQG